MSIEQQFLDRALEECGTPYIWGGKGNKVFDPSYGLVSHKFVDMQNKPLIVLDCSGLVTWALYLATGGRMDLRGSHSAKTIFDTFPTAPENVTADNFGCLLLYPHHVAIGLGNDIVLDANKGDESCITILHAQDRGARVEVHRNLRRADTLLGYRRIPVDISELRKV